MDYDYAQSDRQFEEENEEYEETRHQYRQRTEEEIGGNQSFNNRGDSSLSSSSSAGKLFVGGLSWDTTEETFSSYFSKYGEITDAVIMMDRNTGRPRGFGFITFSDPAAAERALEDEHVIDGRTVEVKRTVPKGDMEGKGIVRAKKIFIGGIPPSLTEDELKEYFSPYGSIVDHQIMLDHKTGRSRGFGFVTFETEDAVEQIFSEGKKHELGGKQVEIKKAEPKRPGSGGVGGGDYGSASKSYGGYNNRSSGYGASHSSANQYGGKMGRGYEGYGNYNAYGGYGGSYPGSAASFYGGYGGGYGFGYGYGGAMMYGGGGYGGSGYGNPSAYGSNASGYAGVKGYGKNGENGNFAAGKGYGYGNGVGGGYGASSNSGGSSGGGGGAGSAPGRYHPYRK